METDDRLELSGNASDRLLMLRYDFLKHLTSLSILSIGGTVTFAGSIFEKVADKHVLWLATGGLAAAAVIAFTGQMTLLRDLDPDSRAISRWRKWLLGHWGLGAAQSIAFATFCLAMSVGALIAFAFEHLR